MDITATDPIAELQQRFALLLAQHQGIVLKVARGYCAQRDDRSDLIQEISTQAWRAFPAFDPQRAQFSTWLYRIALNTAISQLRSRELRRHYHSDAALDDLLRAALKRDSVKDAVAHAMEISGRPRREIYARALTLKDKV